MEPLKEPRLRTGKARRVTRINDVSGQLRKNGQKLAGPASANYIAIVTAIKNGTDIDPSLYRNHNGRSDTLLMELGILHIHLYPNSKELLFLRQYDDYVEFVEINDHTPFEDMGAVDYFEAKYRNILWTAQRKTALEAKKNKVGLADAVERLKSNPVRKTD